MVKLSPAQKDLLKLCGVMETVSCVDSYPPRKRLISLGLVTEHEGRLNSWIKITDAGRTALAEGGAK